MSNVTPNLGNIITNPLIRKTIYGVYVILIVIAGALQVAYASVESFGGQPDWLTAGLAVLAYLGVPVGGLALANTATVKTGDHADI